MLKSLIDVSHHHNQVTLEGCLWQQSPAENSLDISGHLFASNTSFSFQNLGINMGRYRAVENYFLLGSPLSALCTFVRLLNRTVAVMF
jgi:hypothetical protein